MPYKIISFSNCPAWASGPVPVIFYPFVFILGAVVGSFLNVCIYRMPRNESIVFPNSHCPYCNSKIKWFDNLPLVSIFILRSKCRKCNSHISYRYFLVELLTALLFVAIFSVYGPSIEFLIFAALIGALIVSSFIDIEHQIIPDEITLGGLVIGLIISLIYPHLHGVQSMKYSIINSLLGAVAGGGSIYLTGVFGRLIFRKEAMGGGDVKFMAMIGSIIGWQKALLTFFIAPFFGSVVGIIVLLKNKDHVIPYGPFLSMAALVSIFFGDKILSLFIF